MRAPNQHKELSSHAPQWYGELVNHLAQSAAECNPNAGLRIHLPHRQQGSAIGEHSMKHRQPGLFAQQSVNPGHEHQKEFA